MDKEGSRRWKQKKFRGQLATGGGEKDRFTVQLTYLKNGGKIRPFIIFKAKPADGIREYRSNTVAYELRNRLLDNEGNTYPSEEEVFLTCNDTANSSAVFTQLILEHVLFPELSVMQGKRSGLLVDDFKGHSHRLVKEYVRRFKSGDDDDEEDNRYDIVDFHIMAGGIRPKVQPIDMILGKVFKGLYRDEYDNYMLTAPTRNEHPITPSRQLCATWVVKAWEQIPEALIRKAWDLANYKSMEEIERENYSREIIELTEDNIIEAIAPVADEQILLHYLSEDNVYDNGEFDDENVVV